MVSHDLGAGAGSGLGRGVGLAKNPKFFRPKMKILKMPKTCSNDVFEVFGGELSSLRQWFRYRRCLVCVVSSAKLDLLEVLIGIV